MSHVIAAVYTLAATCQPDQGMGCFPCCGQPASTVAQTGNAALGAAALLGAGFLLWKILFGKNGGGR